MASFNTQPPEGGWSKFEAVKAWFAEFQHTAARRRLVAFQTHAVRLARVSTHSRPKAAGPVSDTRVNVLPFQHTAARRRLDPGCFNKRAEMWFQHTAARRRLGWMILSSSVSHLVSTHSRPKAAGPKRQRAYTRLRFQHTAARRRLDILDVLPFPVLWVSTHSRPKAAGPSLSKPSDSIKRFNTQPPEGGWFMLAISLPEHICFNTQPPEGGWVFVYM